MMKRRNFFGVAVAGLASLFAGKATAAVQEKTRDIEWVGDHPEAVLQDDGGFIIKEAGGTTWTIPAGYSCTAQQWTINAEGDRVDLAMSFVRKTPTADPEQSTA